MRRRVAVSADIGDVAAAIADIARTFESSDEANARVRHALTLMARLVPYEQCVLYERGDGRYGMTVAVPPQPAGGAGVIEFLQRVMHFMEGRDERPPAFEPGGRVVLPIIGLDEILGVLLVEPGAGGEYEPHHLRLLSAICSQLGAYLTMVRLHSETARQAADLVKREEQLRGAGQFREEFIGVVGHDLRNPLSAIRTGAQILLQRDGLDAAAVGVAGRIASSADRMSRMIDELLDFTRGRLGGGIQIRRSAADLAAVCREVVEELRAARPDRAVDLRVSGDARGHWDTDRLTQLVSNLVGNALQHSAEGTRVEVRVTAADGQAAVTVMNQGAPIPADQIGRIFEPFRRAGQSGERSGLGLGLYICERIVSAHGGTIAVTSTPQQTAFEVRLPCRRAGDRQA
jgi:signal transduction histidine kinase